MSKKSGRSAKKDDFDNLLEEILLKEQKKETRKKDR
jgi:hypothetical protein